MAFVEFVKKPADAGMVSGRIESCDMREGRAVFLRTRSFYQPHDRRYVSPESRRAGRAGRETPLSLAVRIAGTGSLIRRRDEDDKKVGREDRIGHK